MNPQLQQLMQMLQGGGGQQGPNLGPVSQPGQPQQPPQPPSMASSMGGGPTPAVPQIQGPTAGPPLNSGFSDADAFRKALSGPSGGQMSLTPPSQGSGVKPGDFLHFLMMGNSQGSPAAAGTPTRAYPQQ